MKTWKKSMALLLTLVMLLSLGVTAFAAPEIGKNETTVSGSITVENPIAEQTYTAYKIFDVTYDTTGTAYSYTIDENSEWFTTVQKYATTANGLTLTKVDGTTTYIVTTTDKFSAPSFANALKAAAAGKTGTALTVTDGKATVDGLPLGYYFVSSTSGALCNLTTTNPTATIHDKNDFAFSKTVDKHSYDLGEKVTFTITTKVPDYTGFDNENEEYLFMIEDKLDDASENLTFDGKDTITVTIDGNKVYPAENGMNVVQITGVTDTQFAVAFNTNAFKSSGAKFGDEIKVTYTATVKKAGVVLHNDASLSLDVGDDPSKVAESREYVYSTLINIDKYAANNTETKLADAEFVFYKKVTENDTEKTLYYKWNEADSKVEWTETEADATVLKTNDTGAAAINGVADGTYYLEETKAPKGYNLLAEPVEVVVNGSSSIADTANLDNAVLTKTVSIANQTGAELPSTGGIGTTIFYVLGGLLVVGAAVLLITKKRMAEQ